jgi:glucose/arabinose dehydrogenase
MKGEEIMRNICNLKTLSIVLLMVFFCISPSAGAQSWPNIALNQLVTGLNLPTYITNAGDSSGRIFVLERAGTIRIVKNGVLFDTPFLDITSEVTADPEADGGILGLAFPPGFKRKQYFYVYYTNLLGNPVLSRFHVSATDPDLADAATEEQLLTFTASEPGKHQGGWIGFHPLNHFLYVATGDTGPQGDPYNNAQNPAVLKGKILRIDVEHGPGTSQPYRIPRRNPFVNNPDYLPEIWALGLRNPFRCSFTGGGALYITDVGLDTTEEIDFEPANSHGGKNYGWNILEGPNFTGFNGDTPPTNYQAPVAFFNHPTMEAIIGGYVFRGPKFRHLRGIYFFADFGEYGQGTGQIFGMRKSDNWATKLLLPTNFEPSTFGEDQQHNLYVADIFNGIIYQIIDAGP